MRSPLDIEKELRAVSALSDVTGVFEGIASMRIARIKDQVLQSQDFFSRLWQLYTQIRVDNIFRYGRSQLKADVIDKELIIAVTADTGLTGDIDNALISQVIAKYNPENQDIIVVGRHGASQLALNGIECQKVFKMPTKDQNINVMPIIREIQNYRTATIYYQSYTSLMYQQVKNISLDKAVRENGKNIDDMKDVATEETYIFEPSVFEVVDHLERSMMNITLSQVILDSKLAQYASRFRAMTIAHQNSRDIATDLTVSLNHIKRAIKDERLKEITNSLKKNKYSEVTA